jgi:probable phosphoglycerate mutase
MSRRSDSAGDGGDTVPAVPFFFLRHGETDWNRRGLLQGSTDIPLNATGIAQAHAAAGRLTGLGIVSVVSSPLVRARATAEIVAAALGLPVELEPDIAEVSWGSREGTPEEDVIRRWLADETPASGEPLADFLARVRRGLSLSLARPAPVLVVAHGGVFRALRTLFGLPEAARVANARPLRLVPGPAGWAIEDPA